MSLLLASGVACAYAASVVGTHRVSVARRRAKALGFPTLRWLDWDTLLSGLWPQGAGRSAEGPQPRDGGPASALLAVVPEPELAGRHGLLSALVAGHRVEPHRWAGAGFSESESRWLSTLALLTADPQAALATLERSGADTASAVYFREHLALELRTGPLSLEWSVFSSKRRLAQALQRFETAPELYFARARASARLGQTEAVLDDLARAVYFSRERPFFLRAVIGLTIVEELRPGLLQQCQQGLARAVVMRST